MTSDAPRDAVTSDELRDPPDQTSELIGSVSHELRTPLHAMLGFAELLAETNLSDQQHEYASAIVREGRTLERMIAELLDFSRVEAGRVDLVERPYSPVNLANEVVHLLESDARARNLRLAALTGMERGDLSRGDDRRVRQVLVNLVTNAIKFTPFGSITIAVEADENTQQLHYEVRDTGIGIPDDTLGQLFQPFQQVRSNDQGRGTGLGLAICRRLAELMDGTIEVESQVGVGSTFRLTVPLEPARRNADLRQVEKMSQPAVPSRILVVDDSQLNLVLARGQLERLGHTVEVAPDGETALDILAEGEIDLVLMDWRMPGIDGLETTRRFRTLETHAPIPVIAMTANARAGDRNACLEAGLNDVLTKPVALEALSTMLSIWLDHDPGERAEVAPSAVSIDRRALRDLAEELGDPDVARAVVATFLDELPQRRSIIRQSDPNAVDEPTRRAAHSLKSASALVGASRLATLCSRLEALDDGDTDVAALVEEIDDEAGRVQDSVSAFAADL